MPGKWNFLQLRRGDINVDPIQREFFTTEALNNLAEPVVRETVQNSLDAASPNRKVSVRFWLSGTEAAAPQKIASKLFSSLWPHLNARGSGLRGLPDESSAVQYLVIEDFGTRGLGGDPEQSQDRESNGVKNDFFYFWRNVGRSGKHEKDRGRWGLGKTVFPASSRINAFWGLTVRDEKPKRLLMGQCVLKVHQLGGQSYSPYGYFGNIHEDGFASPISDESIIREFSSLFRLKRTVEPGLSIVIPFSQDEITADSILLAVLQQYFFAILSGSLEVTIGTVAKEWIVDDSTLIPLLENMGGSECGELMPLAKLAEWACDEGEAVLEAVRANLDGKAAQWNDDALNPDRIPQLRSHFEEGVRLAFRIPLTVHPEINNSEQTHFDVYLQQDLSLERHRPHFIREGIVISDAVKQKQREVYALVVIDDKPLAAMLGDAENPAHTEWQKDSEHFRGRYKYGPSTLNFIKNSVSELVRLITRSKDEKDFSALADIFYLPELSDDEDKRKRTVSRPTPGSPPIVDPPPPPPPPPPPSKSTIRVGKVDGGFSISQSENGIGVPDEIKVMVAYEVRRGNAFAGYCPADFEVDKRPVEISLKNAAIISAGENTILLGELEPGFRVEVRGFDPSRDIIVRALPKESQDAAPV